MLGYRIADRRPPLKTRKTLLALVALSPAVAFAHPGHGTTDPGSLRHYLVEPVHVVTLAAIAVAIELAWFVFRRMTRRSSSERA